MLSSMHRAYAHSDACAAEMAALIHMPSRTETRAVRRGGVSTDRHREGLIWAVTADRGPDPMRRGGIACGKRRAHHRVAIR